MKTFDECYAEARKHFELHWPRTMPLPDPDLIRIICEINAAFAMDFYYRAECLMRPLSDEQRKEWFGLH